MNANPNVGLEIAAATSFKATGLQSSPFTKNFFANSKAPLRDTKDFARPTFTPMASNNSKYCWATRPLAITMSSPNTA
jgi:hypothetical protein